MRRGRRTSPSESSRNRKSRKLQRISHGSRAHPACGPSNPPGRSNDHPSIHRQQLHLHWDTQHHNTPSHSFLFNIWNIQILMSFQMSCGHHHQTHQEEDHQRHLMKQLDRLYESHPRLHQESREATDHQLTQPLRGVIGSTLSGMPSGFTSRQTPPTMTIRPIGVPLSSVASASTGLQPFIGAQLAIGAPLSTPTTKSRGRTAQTSSLSSPSQLCPGQQPLSSTSSSSLTTTPSTSTSIARPVHHETYLQQEEAQHPQPMEIDSPLSIERSSPSSLISWQDSSSTEQHHLARYPGFWSQDGYQGFWGHPPRLPSSIVENILMEIDQLNIDSKHFEKIDIIVHISKLIKDHHWRSSERNINHYLTEREDSNNNLHRSWHHGDHQQEQRWQHQDTWHGWHYHPRQPQSSDSDLASQRPIGAGREWDSYILQRQQHQLSLERASSSSHTSASTWARQQDGGHRTRIHLNIFHLEASWHVATWSSSTTKMNAIILPGDPIGHHDLIPDILSQSITYILNINRPRVELRSHLAAALHAVPPGVAHQSQKRTRVGLSHLDQQPPPRRHHQELIQYLRYHIREHRAFVGHAAFTIEGTYTLLATACRCYIEQLPSVPPTRATRHRAQEESASSSSTSSSNIEQRGPQLHIGMVCITDKSEENFHSLTSKSMESSSRPETINNIIREELTSRVECDIKNEIQEEIELTLSGHDHVPRHQIVYNILDNLI